MDLNELKAYCLKKKGVTECFPFDEETLVFKVLGKMFALTNINAPDLTVNLKCEPYLAVDLRREYKEITPGYHMNKVHWNTLDLASELEEEKIKWLIDLSYDLVVKTMTKKEKERLMEEKDR